MLMLVRVHSTALAAWQFGRQRPNAPKRRSIKRMMGATAMQLRWFAIALLLLAVGAEARAEEPSLLKPYLYTPPQPVTSPLEQQKALIYRSQVQDQLKRLERGGTRGELDSFNQRLLLDTRSELQKMNGVLGY
jgi:hypothetical protein